MLKVWGYGRLTAADLKKFLGTRPHLAQQNIANRPNPYSNKVLQSAPLWNKNYATLMMRYVMRMRANVVINTTLY